MKKNAKTEEQVRTCTTKCPARKLADHGLEGVAGGAIDAFIQFSAYHAETK